LAALLLEMSDMVAQARIRWTNRSVKVWRPIASLAIAAPVIRLDRLRALMAREELR